MKTERYGTRDLTYSAWHRAASIRRFVGWEHAQLLTMCDADSVLFLEYSPMDKEPLALIEAAMDVGQEHKPATAIARLAKRAGIPAYLVLYKKDSGLNPANPRWNDVASFRIRRLWPKPEIRWRHLSPTEWASALLHIRAWSARKLDVEAANEPKYEPFHHQRRLFEGP